MTLPTFAFDDFVADVANTIEQHLRASGELTALDSSPALPLAPPALPIPRSPDPYLLDPEKIVWHYPDSASRIIDEVR